MEPRQARSTTNAVNYQPCISCLYTFILGCHRAIPDEQSQSGSVSAWQGEVQPSITTNKQKVLDESTHKLWQNPEALSASLIYLVSSRLSPPT